MTWYQTFQGNYIRSDPLCIHNETVITRNCTNDKWIPPLAEVPPCYTAVKQFDPSSCPPGFKYISKSFCYQIKHTSQWDYPCIQSGGATVITELNKNETESLLNCLNNTNYRYFWLPAQRRKVFAPIVWSTPGPNWGHNINSKALLPLNLSMRRNCLLLDIHEGVLVTDICNNEYPSLCLYKNDLQYPGNCPYNYHAFRYMLDDGRCFGIEKSEIKLTFKEFLVSKCKKPMGNGEYGDLRRYVFSKLAQVEDLPTDSWCWLSAPVETSHTVNAQIDKYSNISDTLSLEIPPLVNVINRDGLIALMNSLSTLSCMACETDMIYGDTEFLFEYDEEIKQLYLTVYFPSGLWKYKSGDRGVQCFSDADGFFRVIDINDLSTVDMRHNWSSTTDTNSIEKEIYVINLVTDRSARYWCEGHKRDFSLISTQKILVNPQGNEVHVFSLVIKFKVHLNENNNIIFDIPDLVYKISFIFNVKKVLLMDILEYNYEVVTILFHLHVAVNNTYTDLSRNLQLTLNFLILKAEINLPKFNYTFVNISSSVYCLPTTSTDSILLDWELTSIGYITAPRQFCLQENGLPVNRQCHGSYLLGSSWGEIEGKCDISYRPTKTTTFLFNIIQGYTDIDYISRFLTIGVGFVLEDINILIPADIYYLSICFRHILDLAKRNITLIETGDIDNIAWIMDRMMKIDNNNLRLAQTLNSTNAILESTNNIIELITLNNITVYNNKTLKNIYQLAIQPGFVIQVSYPELSNVTGIAILSNGTSNNFTDMIIQPLYKNTTIDDVLSIRNLEVATWLPHSIVDNLKKVNNYTGQGSKTSNFMHLVINVYNSNAIFQELSENEHIVNSRIVEVTVPGYETSLEHPLPLIFKEMNVNKWAKSCGYWDFQTEKGNIPGSWSKRGCILQATTGIWTICKCYHLTHFAQLINIRSKFDSVKSPIDDTHEKVLNIITLIGSFLSLLGIVGIWITATVFESWRKKTGTKVLLQLSISIALPLILIIIFNLESNIIVESHKTFTVPKNMVALCVGLGALFHYSVLANFMWMLITAILQFIRYVRVLGVLRPSRFVIKLTLIAWGFPIIPVIAVLLADYMNYVPNPSSSRSFCYPSGLYLILGVIVPVCMILLVNVILFILVIKSISKSTNMRATDRSLVCAQFRLSIFLFFLLGLTWIFGVASFSGNLHWSYLFCLTSTMQGFVLFIYFVICDPSTRSMWVTVMKPQFSRSRVSVTTISSG